MTEVRTVSSQRETAAPLERLRGMQDVGPEAYRARRQVLDRLLEVLRHHGYRLIETPVLEPTELFLRKSGAERIAQMYAVMYRNREIALRPEHTASVLRYYVESLQTEPLPLRLSYAGPVFRYERPQAGRSRQFTEVGCELLGAPGPAGDAEVIHLAAEVLDVVGIRPRIVVGHVGIVLDFLSRLPLRQRVRDWLLWSMERLRKGQEVELEPELASLTGSERLANLYQKLGAALREVSGTELERWVLAILQETGVQVAGGSRTPEEIVSGVLAKLTRSHDTDDLRRSFAFVRDLAAIHGPPDEAIPALRALIERHGLDPSPMTQLESVLDLLAAYGIERDRIELSPGMARGLHYYTGVLFEVYAADQPSLQLCGGGRYDDLAQVFGARAPLPACGFSCGLERIAEAASLPEPAAPEVTLVAPAAPEALARAAGVAESLRAAGEVVELDVRNRSAGANRRYARRRGIHRLVLVYPDGRVQTETISGKGNDRE